MFGAIAIGSLLFLATMLVSAQQEYEKVTLHNHTEMQLTLNVDDHYGCTANAGVDCTSDHETVDDHTLYALAGQTVVAKRLMAAQPGRRVEWTVCRLKPGQSSCDQ
jgi:hypothetical protein